MLWDSSITFNVYAVLETTAESRLLETDHLIKHLMASSAAQTRDLHQKQGLVATRSQFCSPPPWLTWKLDGHMTCFSQTFFGHLVIIVTKRDFGSTGNHNPGGSLSAQGEHIRPGPTSRQPPVCLPHQDRTRISYIEASMRKCLYYYTSWRLSTRYPRDKQREKTWPDADGWPAKLCFRALSRSRRPDAWCTHVCTPSVHEGQDGGRPRRILAGTMQLCRSDAYSKKLSAHLSDD